MREVKAFEKKPAVIVEKSLQRADGTRFFCGGVVTVSLVDGENGEWCTSFD